MFLWVQVQGGKPVWLLECTSGPAACRQQPEGEFVRWCSVTCHAKPRKALRMQASWFVREACAPIIRWKGV